MARVKGVLSGEIWDELSVYAPQNSHNMPAGADEVSRTIQDFIISKNIKKGERLPSERDLADILSSSRPTIRRAMRTLVVKGLIKSQRGSGSYVLRSPEDSLAATVNLMLTLDQSSVQHLHELRLWLETVGIVQAIERAQDNDVLEAEHALNALKENTGDILSWMSADTHYHLTLIKAARNPYLTSIFQGIHSTLIEYEYKSWVQSGSTPRWLRKDKAVAVTAIHDPILAALKARDKTAAKTAVLHHHQMMAEHLAASQRQDQT